MAVKGEAQSSTDWMVDGQGHPRRWPILGVLVTSLLVVVLDNTILNIALPTIQRDLEATQTELVWAVDSYILVFAALLFTWGALGDKYGRKRVLVIGLVIFGLASAASAFAPVPQFLIASRAIMGIGGAAVLPVTLAIITVVFPPHERGKAIGTWAAAVGAAVALGPVLGGLLLQNPEWSSWITGNDWGAVFLINVPIVIVGLIAIIRVVPETRNPRPQPLDVPGLVMSFVGLVLVVYGIIHASETRTFLVPSVYVPIAVGVIVLVAFVVFEARSTHRSFDVSLFTNRGYAVSLVAVSLPFFALSGLTFTLPFYLQIVRGYSTLIAGLFFVPFAVGQLLSAPRSAALVARFGYRVVMFVGLAIVVVSLVMLAYLSPQTPVWTMLLGFFMFGLGMGAVIAPASTVMQNVLPLPRVGAGSAVQNTVRQVFGALGVAVISTLLATRFARGFDPALAQISTEVPEQLRADASQSLGAAVEFLGSALQAGLPAPAAAAAKEVAVSSFISAAQLTFMVSAALVLVAAATVLFGLPRIVPPVADPQVAPAAVGPGGVHEIAAKDSTAAAAGAAELELDYPHEAQEEYVEPRRRGTDPASEDT